MSNAMTRTWMAACLVGLGVVALTGKARVEACGGFFCQQLPINQAGEQIIFRRDGDRVTAVILIQYQGTAEDFSWVVPVPGVPDLSVGSDLVFQPLEFATRPQFNLIVEGEECFDPFIFGFASPTAEFDDASGAADDGVEILAQQDVGPFEIVVVTSDDAQALATWLEDNNYDLDGRGEDLIAPYVAEGMNFAALRLRQDQGVGDIQPLIMSYTSPKPMIPIRLTAVAAEPNMGVIVWMLGESRAVPLNYLSVEPNLTRLNWFSGSFNAYASYQTLVTAAMDEAGGQGFATDYAGSDLDYMGQLPDAAQFRSEIDRLRQLDTATFYSDLFFNGVFPQTKVLEILRRQLPLPADVLESNYVEAGVLNSIFGEDAVTSAREAITTELLDTVVVPLEEHLAVFEGSRYMTRLYTTLSPDEMTLDPEFAFNADLPDQPLERSAALALDCVLGQTRWSLTLGAGTGRDGEVVIEGIGDSPLFGPLPVIDQLAVATSASVREQGDPEIVTANRFSLAQVGTASDGGTGGGVGGIAGLLSTLCGNGIFAGMILSLAGLTLFAGGRRGAA